MNELKISYKKSSVKLKGKTMLLEVINPFTEIAGSTLYMFAERSLYKKIKENPYSVLEVFRGIEIFSKIVERALSTNTKISLTHKRLFTRNTYTLSNRIISNRINRGERNE